MDETNVQCSQQTLITCLLCTLRTRTLFGCAECCCRCSLRPCTSVYRIFFSVVSETMGIVCVRYVYVLLLICNSIKCEKRCDAVVFVSSIHFKHHNLLSSPLCWLSVADAASSRRRDWKEIHKCMSCERTNWNQNGNRMENGDKIENYPIWN